MTVAGGAEVVVEITVVTLVSDTTVWAVEVDVIVLQTVEVCVDVKVDMPVEVTVPTLVVVTVIVTVGVAVLREVSRHPGFRYTSQTRRWTQRTWSLWIWSQRLW